MTPRAELRFECTGCGHCCTGNPKDFWVEVSRTEQARIAKHLGISLAWLRRRYIVREDEGDGISMRGGQCVFLDGQRCGIYAVRPTQCRTYPFWPELMAPKAWRAEAKRCEGIDRGEIVPLEKIRRLLKRAGAG